MGFQVKKTNSAIDSNGPELVNVEIDKYEVQQPLYLIVHHLLDHLYAAHSMKNQSKLL